MPCFGSQEAVEEEQRTIYFGANSKNEKYVSNAIKTSKYSIVNFVPKNLWEQLQRFMNVWFIFLSGLMLLGQQRVEWGGQQISLFPAVVPPWGTLFALIPMMMLNAVLAAIDDYRRHKADDLENNKTVQCVDKATGEVRGKPSKDVAVGDLLLIANDNDLPADVVALVASGDQGTCYVSTANLDGETNLKVKSAAQGTQHILPEHGPQKEALGKLCTISGSVLSEPPSQDIHNFNGRITVQGQEMPLDGKNLLLRGTILRNTAWCIGLVVYTGPQTRMVMNSRPAPSKVATLEWVMNVTTVIMICFQCVLAIVSCAGALRNRPTMAKYFYLSPLEEYVFPGWVGQWLGFFLLYSNLVPVSCFATVEMCNFVQAYFINNDEGMLDRDTMTAARCRATNLCHELGQVSYIFSDKTGTLTQNVMELKLLCIGGDYFGSLDSPLKGFQGGDKFEQARRGQLGNLIEAFLEVMAVGHTVIVSPTGAYEAESAEEGTMVEACARYGYELKARAGHTMELMVGPKGQATSAPAPATSGGLFGSFAPARPKPSAGEARRVKYDVLGIHAFNSDRKRMSLVVRKENGEVLLLIKGADNVMMERASKPDPNLLKQLDDCSRKGLRCLVIGRRKLNESEVQGWLQEHARAEASMNDREKLLDALGERIEKNLEILGATAIEDKLQENVGETIQMIRWAGVKLWVLTGDKLETARNIGFSTNVLSDSMLILKLEAGSELGNCLKQAKNSSDRQVALLVTGQAISDIEDNETIDTFLKLGMLCRVVLACRVSPSQKALVVKMVRDGVQPTPVTLSVGDGANDVPMIQEAHIGVGIFGKEGRQAVNNSDFAIGQFQFLKHLLFLHGRWNYLRVAKVILYSFWRNSVLVITMFFYSMAAGWSGTSLYEDLVRGTFNVATALPSLCIGIFDVDMDKTDSLSLYAFNEAEKELDKIQSGRARIPKGGILEYRRGIHGEDLNTYKSTETVMSALFHSILLYVNMRVCYIGFDMHQAGDIFTWGTSVFICLILQVMYRGLLVSKTWSWGIVISTLVSVVVFILFIIIYGSVGTYRISNTLQMYMVWKNIFRVGIFYICLLTVPLVAISVDTFKQYLFDQLLVPHFWLDQDEVEAIETEALHPGAEVVIHGMLDDFDEDNLQEGKCMDYYPDTDSWTVRLAETGHLYQYKARNLAMRNTQGAPPEVAPMTSRPQHNDFVMSHVEDRPHRPAHKIRDIPPWRGNEWPVSPSGPTELAAAEEVATRSASYALIKDSEDNEQKLPIDLSNFAQQRLPVVKNPVWSHPCGCTFLSLMASAALFSIFGLWGLMSTNSSHEVKILYDGKRQKPPFYSAWMKNSGEVFVDQPCPAGAGKSCDVTLNVKEDMDAPITAFFQIDPFYQNYYDYYASVSWKQLIGQEDPAARCSKDTSFTEAGDAIIPCGLQARSFFNDSFEVINVQSADGTNHSASLAEEGIAWQSDLERFKNPEGYTEPESTLWLYERFPEIIKKETGVKNPHFVSWMRLDAFPDVRKHYGVLNRDLRKGDKLHLRINPRYPLPEGARKEFGFSTLNVFGGNNNDFAWFFLAAALIAILMALFVVIIDRMVLPHFRSQRFEADMSEEVTDEDESS